MYAATFFPNASGDDAFVLSGHMVTVNSHFASRASRRNNARAERVDGAFTLIEIVLVITIIAVLGAALVYGIKGNVDVAKETRVESDIKSIITQIKVYEARNLQPPTTEQGLKALVELPTIEPIPERWTQLMEEMPKDPWKRDFRYQYPARRSKADYDVYSLGPDGVESNDDIGNWKISRKN